MSGQMDFFDDEPPDDRPLAKPEPWDAKQGPANVFWALKPTPAWALEMQKTSEALDRANGICGILRGPDLLHITVQELDTYAILPKQAVINARQIGESVVSPAIDVVFDRAMTFGDKGPYVLLVGEGAEQIRALGDRIRLAMRLAGLPLKKRLGTPHMTLSYKGRLVAEHAIKPIHWRVDEFVLINSHVGQSRHEVLGNWPLRS